MKIVETSDGSLTFYNETYDETYHSKFGAFEETLMKFIKPCDFIFNSKNDISILDLGFGLGLNCFSTIFYLSTFEKEFNLTFISLEKDNDLINSLIEFYSNFELNTNESRDHSINFDKDFCKDIIKQILNKLNEFSDSKNPCFCMEYNYKNIKIKHYFLFDDARQFDKNFESSFSSPLNYDICYFDPFSYRHNLELWTYDFFNKVKQNLNFILLTYSYSLPILNSLYQLNFQILEIDPQIRSKPSIIALKSNSNAFLVNYTNTYDILSSKTIFYFNSKSAIPYRDPDFDLCSEEIKNNQFKEKTNSTLKSLSSLKKITEININKL